MIFNRSFKIVFYLILFIFSFFLQGCNQEDDIAAIFTGNTWYLVSFYTTTNWQNGNISNAEYPIGSEEQRLIAHNGTDRFFIIFEQETFTAKGLNNSFSGKWQADGKSNTLTMQITEGSRPTGGTTADNISQMFYDHIEKTGETGYYIGDINILKIFQPDKKHFMQFSRKRAQ